MTTHEKALEAAHTVYERFGQSGDLKTARTSNDRLMAIIHAYNAALLPEDAAGLVERMESHMGKQDIPVLLADCRQAASLIQSQAARIATLEAGLRPFAQRCDEAVRLDDGDNDGVTVKTKHLRTAHALLNGERKG